METKAASIQLHLKCMGTLEINQKVNQKDIGDASFRHMSGERSSDYSYRFYSQYFLCEREHNQVSQPQEIFYHKWKILLKCNL
jgi:hypothetical protein